MADVTEYINDRIDRYMKNTDVIHCTMGRITELPDYSDNKTKYRVEIIQSNTNYALTNFTGVQLQTGQHVQVFYKNYLNEKNAWIGGVVSALSMVRISEGDYNALSEINPNTVYFVMGDNSCHMYMGTIPITEGGTNG